MSLAPTTSYDIFPNDYLRMMAFMSQVGQVVDNKPDIVSGGSYPIPAPGGLLAPSYVMYDNAGDSAVTPEVLGNEGGVWERGTPCEDVSSQSSGSSFLQTPPPVLSSSSSESAGSWDPSWFQPCADPIPFVFPPTPGPSVPSTSRLEAPIMSYPTCSQPSSTFPPDPPRLDFDPYSEEEEEPRNFTGPLRRERGRAGRRARNPYKRPPGSGYNTMMATLPEDLRGKVKSEYDCCTGIDKKDNSSNMKHWFSNNHFITAVGDAFFHLQPMFVCPSFIAMMLGCRSAKGGRFDSSERHCGNCEAYRGFAEGCLVRGMVLSPLLLTRGEFEAIRDFRKQALPGQSRSYSPQVQDAVFKLLKMLVTSQVFNKGKGA